ncbi:hypothetical protein U1Q18_018656 [Sarracenia purpurea var. burkii]
MGLWRQSILRLANQFSETLSAAKREQDNDWRRCEHCAARIAKVDFANQGSTTGEGSTNNDGCESEQDERRGCGAMMLRRDGRCGERWRRIGCGGESDAVVAADLRRSPRRREGSRSGAGRRRCDDEAKWGRRPRGPAVAQATTRVETRLAGAAGAGEDDGRNSPG